MIDKEKILENVKLKISISNFDEEENVEIRKNKNNVLKFVTAVCCMLILTTGIVFAKDIENYVRSLFTNSTKAIDEAVENGYVQKEESDYTYDKDIGIKVDSLVLDDLNLDISFLFETKKEMVKSIRFDDFNITTENKKIVYSSKFEYAEESDNLPIYNSLTWKNLPEKITDTTFTDSILLGLRAEKETFKELYIDVTTVKIIYIDDKEEIIEGNWNLSVNISEKMKNNTCKEYIMVEENEYIEYCIGKLTPTGLNIDLTLKEALDPIEYIKDNLDNLNNVALFYLKFNDEIISPSATELDNDSKEKYTMRYDNIGIFNDLDEIKLYLAPFDFTVILMKKDVE